MTGPSRPQDVLPQLSQAAEAARDELGRHMTSSEASSLVEGLLDRGLRERLLDHASWCEPCTDLLLDARAPLSAAEEQPAEASWQRLRGALARDFSPRPSGVFRRFDPATWQAPLVRWPVAAALLACFVLAGAVVRLWPQSPPTVASTMVAPADGATRPEPSLTPAEPQRPPDPPETPPPGLQAFAGTGSLVLEELFPPETVRGGQPDNRHTVTIDPGVPVFALVLHTTDQRAFPTYHVTVARIDRTTIWQGATTRSPHGTFVLGLPAGAFAVGRYRIELFGAREGRSMRIEAYELQVRGRAGDRSGDAAPRGRP